MTAMRSRWAAIGAAVAVSVGAGGVLTTSAAPGSGTVYVPITPCRLMDTRPPNDNVGPRTTPLGAGETYVANVIGTNGNCTIPSDAVAVEMNVAVVNPTAASYLTVFPTGVSRPNASNLNWVAGQPPTSNSVKATLSAGGQISLFNLTGTVDLVVDVAGYFKDASGLSGLPGPTGPTGPAGPAGPQGPAGTVSTPCSAGGLSATQLAELRWDQSVITCPTGTDPRWVAFDGTNLWVTNSSDDTVSRINRITGTTSTFAAGDYPFGVVYDGTSIWTANGGINASGAPDSVSKINPTTGAATQYAVGQISDPYGIAFDGTNIWTNDSTYALVEINPSTGQIAASVGVATGYDIAFDGTNLWVPDRVGNTVNRVNVTTNTVNPSPITVGPAAPALTTPYGIIFDGTYVWVTNYDAGTVVKITASTGVVSATISGFSGPRGIVSDGTYVWVSNYDSGILTRIDRTTNATTNYTVGQNPRGIAFDGKDLWVVLGSVAKLAQIRR